jgi:restriction system protein
MSSKAEKVIWGIHAGRTGDAETLFLKHNVIALGWASMGNLTNLDANRDAFIKQWMEKEPGLREKQYITGASQVFRFVHEAKIGDIIVFPAKLSRRIYIGEIVGQYRFDSREIPNYPQHRPVKWLKDFPRTRFSQGALYEIGSALSFFQVRNYAQEFLAALAGTESVGATPKDESINYVVEDIEQNTRDFILKKLAQELKGHGLAEFLGHLLQKMGYQTRLAPEGPDGGVDIIAHKDELGFEPPIIKVQVKSTEGSVGDPIVSQLYGKVEKSEYGMVVTLGTFTSQARVFERNKSNLRLIDGEQLVELILKYYDSFDSNYKALIPLRRAYVPAPIEDEEER